MRKAIFLIIFGLLFSLPASAYIGTETLRPNAPGDLTNIPYQMPDSGYHWEKVDDTGEGDGDTTTITCWNSASFYTDFYNLPSGSGLGTINKVVVYFKALSGSGIAYGSGRIVIKTHNSVYYGDVEVFPISYVLKSKTWTTNPNTGLAWTWEEISALQIGVMMNAATSVWVNCTQVYVEVERTEEVAPVMNNFGIAEFLGLTLIAFPVFIFLTFVLIEGISGLINFFRYSDRRHR
jgi:hypothetical protein